MAQLDSSTQTGSENPQSDSTHLLHRALGVTHDAIVQALRVILAIELELLNLHLLLAHRLSQILVLLLQLLQPLLLAQVPLQLLSRIGTAWRNGLARCRIGTQWLA